MTSIYKGRVLLRARRRLTPALGLPDGRSQLLARARCTQMACLVDHAPGSLWLSVSRLSASLTVADFATFSPAASLDADGALVTDGNL